jgi:hypothetical protein
MNAALELSDARERIAEIAGILAAGLMCARKSSGLSAHAGESSLDTSAGESGHPDGLCVENAG